MGSDGTFDTMSMDRQTPASTAPKPPTYVSRHSSAYLMGNQYPLFHDYTQMACCLIFFFWFTGLAIVAYCKAKAAVVAYKGSAFEEYKKLNREARLYMVLSEMTMLFILVAVLVVVFVEEDEA